MSVTSCFLTLQLIHTQDVLCEVQIPEDENGLGRETESVGAVVLLALKLPVLIEERLGDAPPSQEHLRYRVVAHPQVHTARRLYSQFRPGKKPLNATLTYS